MFNLRYPIFPFGFLSNFTVRTHPSTSFYNNFNSLVVWKSSNTVLFISISCDLVCRTNSWGFDFDGNHLRDFFYFCISPSKHFCNYFKCHLVFFSACRNSLFFRLICYLEYATLIKILLFIEMGMNSFILFSFATWTPSAFSYFIKANVGHVYQFS